MVYRWINLCFEVKSGDSIEYGFNRFRFRAAGDRGVTFTNLQENKAERVLQVSLVSMSYPRGESNINQRPRDADLIKTVPQFHCD